MNFAMIEAIFWWNYSSHINYHVWEQYVNLLQLMLCSFSFFLFIIYSFQLYYSAFYPLVSFTFSFIFVVVCYFWISLMFIFSICLYFNTLFSFLLLFIWFPLHIYLSPVHFSVSLMYRPYHSFAWTDCRLCRYPRSAHSPPLLANTKNTTKNIGHDRPESRRGNIQVLQEKEEPWRPSQK